MNMMFRLPTALFASTTLFVVLATVGCRNRGVNTEPLEMENFALSERILQLEIELAQRETALERAKHEEKKEKDEDDRPSRSRSDDRPERGGVDEPDIELGDPVNPGNGDKKLPSAPRFESRRDSSGTAATPVSAASGVS